MIWDPKQRKKEIRSIVIQIGKWQAAIPDCLQEASIETQREMACQKELCGSLFPKEEQVIPLLGGLAIPHLRKDGQHTTHVEHVGSAQEICISRQRSGDM